MSQEDRKCGVYRHAWDDGATPIGAKPAPPGTVRDSQRCIRCTSWRHDYVDANGTVVRRNYEYSDSYKKYLSDRRGYDNEAPSMDQLRAQLLARKLSNVRKTKAGLKPVKRNTKTTKRKVYA